jgi:hypothetical protein
MSTLKQRVIDWAESLPDDCTIDDLRAFFQTYLRGEQAAAGEDVTPLPEPPAEVGNPVARIEAIGQEAARLGMSGKLAAIQAYLKQRGRTG